MRLAFCLGNAEESDSRAANAVKAAAAARRVVFSFSFFFLFKRAFAPSAAHVAAAAATCACVPAAAAMWPLVLLRKAVKRPLERDSAPWWQIRIAPSDSAGRRRHTGGSYAKDGGGAAALQRERSAAHPRWCSSSTSNA